MKGKREERNSISIAAKNNVIRTNCIKVKIDNAQENSKYRLWDDRDETVNYIILYRKLEQNEYRYESMRNCARDK